MTESETTKTPARLALDPGLRHRRKPISCCKCLAFVALLAFVVVVGYISYYVGHFAYKGFSWLRAPHQHLYHNHSSDTVPPSHLVVRPLIDVNQTFDVAVTVWVRGTAEEEEKYRMSIPQAAEAMTRMSQLDKDLVALEESGKKPQFVTVELLKNEYIFETPLYSDIAFRGLRLSDKDVSTSIQFRLPTARFREVDLTQYDLRASFVLIPSSSSLIDQIVSYSSWFPDHIKLRPRRAWPFALGSSERGERNIADRALESFGISIPLLEFQEVPSKCPEIEQGIGDIEAESQNKSKKVVKMAHAKRPFVITRTQLRVIKDTHLFKAKDYNQKHMHLINDGCSEVDSGGTRFSRVCRRLYHISGHWETRLDLKVPVSGKDNETENQMAYPPYLDTLSSGASPLDLVPVPINRDNCAIVNGSDASPVSASLLSNATDADFMDITWRVSVSSRSPVKMLFADLMVPNFHSDHNTTESRKAEIHMITELMNGIRGQRFHDDAHPRRRVLIMILTMICVFIRTIFELHYWYTRVSTVGISVPATTLCALGAIVSELSRYFGNKSQSSGFGLLAKLTGGEALLVAFLMIKTISRIELWWWKGTTWLPIVRRVPPSHKERASVRLDAQTSWRVRLTILFSLFGIYYFVKPSYIYIVSPRLPLTPEEPEGMAFLETLLSTFGVALQLTGAILQVLLNHHSRHFAGQHNSVMVVAVILLIFRNLEFVPSVVGRVESPQGVSIHDVWATAFLVTMAWQALTLPSVPQTEVDEDED